MSQFNYQRLKIFLANAVLPVSVYLMKLHDGPRYLRWNARLARSLGHRSLASEIVNDALAKYPAHPGLLSTGCRVSLDMRRWEDAAGRFKVLEEVSDNYSNSIKADMVMAYARMGNVSRAEELLARDPGALPVGRLARANAFLAEAKSDWPSAAQHWFLRAETRKVTAHKVYAENRALMALINAGDLKAAKTAAQRLVDASPSQATYHKALAMISIHQKKWELALKHKSVARELNPAISERIRSDWIYLIGVKEAERQNALIEDDRLRSAGYMSLAVTLKSVDEVNALNFCRLARRQYPSEVGAIVVEIMLYNARPTAAVWWAKRLIRQSDDPQRFYPDLIEGLIRTSRLDEAERELMIYERRFGRDKLWLRGASEIAYRQNDFARLRAILEFGSRMRFTRRSVKVPVTRWIYDLIRPHPTPATFFPEELHDLIIKNAQLYDTRFLSRSLQFMLKPLQSAELTARFQAFLDSPEEALDPVRHQEMLDFFLRARDWGNLDRTLALRSVKFLDSKTWKKVWSIERTRIDILLGRGDVEAAEKAVEIFLKALRDSGLSAQAISIVQQLVARFPISELVIGELVRIAEQLGFDHMASRLSDWLARFTTLDPNDYVGIATKRRCFVVANGPSITTLQLDALMGEDIFCVNRGMRALDLGLPRPKYLVLGDPLVYKNHAQEIDADGATVDRFFVAANCVWRTPPTVPSITFGTSGISLALNEAKPAPLHFHRGSTVVVLAVQLAHLMGYREIYVLGVDLDYSGPSTHFYGGGQKEISRLDNFRPGGSGADLTNFAFANLRQVLERDGTRIYNASPGGKLESLERVDYYSVLGVQRSRYGTTTEA